MFLSHEYIGKVELADLKAEIYDTGKRTLTFKKIYAYQLFENNRLIQQSERLIVGRKDCFIDAVLEDSNLLSPPERVALDYIPEFIPVEEAV